MATLKILVLEDNEMSTIPVGLQQMKQLDGLVLDKNSTLKIEDLASRLENLPELKVLLLRNNGIEKLPENLNGFQRLAVLELSGNRFSDEEKQRIKENLKDTVVKF